MHPNNMAMITYTNTKRHEFAAMTEGNPPWLRGNMVFLGVLASPLEA